MKTDLQTAAVVARALGCSAQFLRNWGRGIAPCVPAFARAVDGEGGICAEIGGRWYFDAGGVFDHLMRCGKAGRLRDPRKLGADAPGGAGRAGEPASGAQLANGAGVFGAGMAAACGAGAASDGGAAQVAGTGVTRPGVGTRMAASNGGTGVVAGGARPVVAADVVRGEPLYWSESGGLCSAGNLKAEGVRLEVCGIRYLGGSGFEIIKLGGELEKMRAEMIARIRVWDESGEKSEQAARVRDAEMVAGKILAGDQRAGSIEMGPVVQEIFAELRKRAGVESVWLAPSGVESAGTGGGVSGAQGVGGDFGRAGSSASSSGESDKGLFDLDAEYVRIQKKLRDLAERMDAPGDEISKNWCKEIKDVALAELRVISERAAQRRVIEPPAVAKLLDYMGRKFCGELNAMPGPLAGLILDVLGTQFAVRLSEQNPQAGAMLAAAIEEYFAGVVVRMQGHVAELGKGVRA